MSLSAMIRRMADAGATPEVIALAVEAIEAEQAKVDAVRAAARDRKRKQRAGQLRDSHATVTGQSQDGPPPEVPPKNNNQTPPLPPPVPSLRSGTARTEFHEIFWPEYPHKTGKPVAEKSFIRARKSHDLEAIMAGLRTYVRVKPADRDWLNPATFLNQERFLDAPAATVHRPTFGQPQGQPPPYVSPFAVSKGPELSREEQLEIGRRFSEQWARK